MSANVAAVTLKPPVANIRLNITVIALLIVASIYFFVYIYNRFTPLEVRNIHDFNIIYPDIKRAASSRTRLFELMQIYRY